MVKLDYMQKIIVAGAILIASMIGGVTVIATQHHAAQRTAPAINGKALASACVRGETFGIDRTTYVCRKVSQRPAAGVTAFNDGFTDSKRDDCQQGDKNACRWLSETR